MERHVDELQEKLARLLTEAAEVSVALDRGNGTIQGVPHSSVIELRAHALGQQLSRMVQQRHLNAMVTQQTARAACPGCGTYCQLHPDERSVTRSTGRSRSQNSEVNARNVVGRFSPSGSHWASTPAS